VIRAQVGEIELLVIEDGICSCEPGFLLVPFDGMPNDELPADVWASLDDDGYLQIPYNPTLIRTPAAMVLVDAGAVRSSPRSGRSPWVARPTPLRPRE
jgi:hypothetical protein